MSQIRETSARKPAAPETTAKPRSKKSEKKKEIENAKAFTKEIMKAEGEGSSEGIRLYNDAVYKRTDDARATHLKCIADLKNLGFTILWRIENNKWELSTNGEFNKERHSEILMKAANNFEKDTGRSLLFFALCQELTGFSPPPIKN